MGVLLENLDEELLMSYVLNHRDNTKWKPLVITNIMVFVYHLGVTMGRWTLPDYMKRPNNA